MTTVPTFNIGDSNFVTEYTNYYKPPQPPTITQVQDPNNPLEPISAIMQENFNEAVQYEMILPNTGKFRDFCNAMNGWVLSGKTQALPHLPAYKTVVQTLFVAWWDLYTSQLGDAPPHTYLVDAVLPVAPQINSVSPLPSPVFDMNPIGAYNGNGVYLSTSFGKLLPVDYRQPFPTSPTGGLYHWIEQSLFGQIDFWFPYPQPMPTPF